MIGCATAGEKLRMKDRDREPGHEGTYKENRLNIANSYFEYIGRCTFML